MISKFKKNKTCSFLPRIIICIEKSTTSSSGLRWIQFYMKKVIEIDYLKLPLRSPLKYEECWISLQAKMETDSPWKLTENEWENGKPPRTCSDGFELWSFGEQKLMVNPSLGYSWLKFESLYPRWWCLLEFDWGFFIGRWWSRRLKLKKTCSGLPTLRL